MIKTINKYLIIIGLSATIFCKIAICNEKVDTLPPPPPQINIQDYISLNDSPRYPKGFTNFDFVNPDAPKKGRIALPAYGSFDNFNPYIFKGTASTEAVALTLDSLGYSPADDIETVYPLIAEKFELPSEETATGTSTWDVLYPHGRAAAMAVRNMSRRGLTALPILDGGQCESLSTG